MMNSWMDNSSHLQEMGVIMGQDHDFAMGIMRVIIDILH